MMTLHLWMTLRLWTTSIVMRLVILFKRVEEAIVIQYIEIVIKEAIIIWYIEIMIEVSWKIWASGKHVNVLVFERAVVKWI